MTTAVVARRFALALLVGTAAIAGALVGSLGTQAIRAEPAPPVPSPLVVAPRESSPVATATVATVPSPDANPTSWKRYKAGEILLVWSGDRLPAGMAGAVAAVEGVGQATSVRRGVVDLTAATSASGAATTALAPGWVIPFDLLAVQPAPYAELLSEPDRSLVAALGPDEIALGATAARLRGVVPAGRWTSPSPVSSGR